MAQAPLLFLFLDFDGTLAPIVSRPDRARLPARTKEILRRLKGLSGVKIAVISGRSLAELKRRIRMSGIIYAGNHGLEIEGDDFSWSHPQANRFRRAVTQLSRRLKKRLGPFHGVILENKGLGLSVHYRLVKEREVARIFSVVKEIADPWTGTASKTLRLTRGKRVWEFRPALDWDKGKTVSWLLARLSGARPFVPVFLGDAFRVLGSRGVTICVGGKRPTLAQFRFRSHRGVQQFLRRLRLEMAILS